MSAKLGVQKAIPLSFRCCVTRFAKTSSFRQGWLVDDRVLAAADNNARWCDQICRLPGIPTATEPGYWVARRRSQQTLRSISVAVHGPEPLRWAADLGFL